MTTRKEAERIVETDDVAAALRYLVDSHSENAAVDLVRAVMNAVAPKHIVPWWKFIREYKNSDEFMCRKCEQKFFVHKNGVGLPEECPSCKLRLDADHFGDANKKVEPVGYRWRKKGQDDLAWRIHGDLRGLDDEELCINLDIKLVYTHPAPPSELVKAVDNLLKVFDETDPEVNCYLHDAIDALRTIREGKP